jgi:SNF2 family DNA or RNA helicase
LVLRRTKNEILDELPEKQGSRVVLPFEDKQKKIYRDIAISYNEKIQAVIAEKGEAQSQLQMLTALLRLRQACSDPGALPGINYQKTPPKIEALTEALAEIVDARESALVFTQFLHTLGKSADVLRAAGLPVFVIHGALARAQREKALHDFNTFPEGAILIMTLKTGGVGLNLTKASYVFHLEPWWNPAVENQATDRAHRLGQKRAVQVYRYIMHESVEEKIERLKTQKQRRFDAMFTELEDLPTAEDTEQKQLADRAAGESTLDSNAANRHHGSQRASHLSRADFDFLLSLQ